MLNETNTSCIPQHLIKRIVKAAYELPPLQSPTRSHDTTTAAGNGNGDNSAVTEEAERLERLMSMVREARAAVEPTNGRPVIPEMVRLFNSLRRETPEEHRFVYDMVIEALKTFEDSQSA